MKWCVRCARPAVDDLCPEECCGSHFLATPEEMCERLKVVYRSRERLRDRLERGEFGQEEAVLHLRVLDAVITYEENESLRMIYEAEALERAAR